MSRGITIYIALNSHKRTANKNAAALTSPLSLYPNTYFHTIVLVMWLIIKQLTRLAAQINYTNNA
jgi:hypothetical protein